MASHTSKMDEAQILLAGEHSAGATTLEPAAPQQLAVDDLLLAGSRDA